MQTRPRIKRRPPPGLCSPQKASWASDLPHCWAVSAMRARRAAAVGRLGFPPKPPERLQGKDWRLRFQSLPHFYSHFESFTVKAATSRRQLAERHRSPSPATSIRQVHSSLLFPPLPFLLCETVRRRVVDPNASYLYTHVGPLLLIWPWPQSPPAKSTISWTE
jgi:hypothetical protein